MAAVDIFEIAIALIGLVGVIDYFLHKNRKFGENPKDATW